MPTGQGGSTSGDVDGATVTTRRRRRIARRSREKKSAGNAEFERQVAAVAARQQEQERTNQMYSLICNVYLPYWYILSDESAVEGGYQGPPNDCLEHSTSSRIYNRACTPSEPTQQKENSNSDFLEGTFLKISSEKEKSTRNKKNSKNKKKKKAKCKKQSHASEMQRELRTEALSTCVNAASGEAPFSSSYVADGIPLLEYSSSSSSSPVTEFITPVYSASSGNEKELSSSSNDFRSFSTSYYSSSVAGSFVNDSYGSNASVNDSYTGSNAWNNTIADDAGSFSDARSEWSWYATGLTDSQGFNKRDGGDDRNRPDDNKNFSVTIRPVSSQEGSLCGDDSSHYGEFQKVVSRKTAKKMRRIQRLRSPTPSPTPTMADSIPISSALVPRAPCEITIGHYIKNDCFSGRKSNHKKGKYKKGPNLSSVPKTSSTDEEDVPGSSRMLLITVHPGNLESSQMALNSTSHDHVSLEAIGETCSSGCLPLQGELKALAPADGDAKYTDSRVASSDKTLSPDHGDAKDTDSVVASSDKTSSLDQGDAKDTDSIVASSDKTSSLDQGDAKDTDSIVASSDKTSSLDQDYAKDTDSRAAFSDKTSSLDHHPVNYSCVDREEQKEEEKEQALSCHESELEKIIKAVNNAYEIQAASDIYMTCGQAVADIDTFLQSATPVIGQIPQTTRNSCFQSQPVHNEPSRNNMPSADLRSVWKWYEEPESFGIEVEIQRRSGYSTSEICAYFVPSLSAIQLFGESSFSTSSLSPGGPLFEYFEWERPCLRPPLFTKIKQLVNGMNLSVNTIFGDPKQLESIKLSDLHPASWFCVAWYPICQIPSVARSSCQSAFLAYHSLGKLVPRTCPADMADGLTPTICPIVGLLSYKAEGEKWFQVGERPRSLESDAAGLLNKRLRALRDGASAMSKGVVPRAAGKARNYHPDYEFFWSRSL